MKKPKIYFMSLLAISVIMLSGCEDDPIVEVSPLVGDYVITKAVLSETLTLVTNEIGPLPIAVGTDITTMIQAALLGSIECTAENSLIELRADNSLYLSCKGSEEEIDAGTWEEVSETVIKLNMNSTAVPSSPTGVVLTVNDVSIDGDLLSGETNVPLPREMLAGVVAAMSGGLATLNMEKTAAAVPVTFVIDLTKQ
jgi:hypothetical protein